MSKISYELKQAIAEEGMKMFEQGLTVGTWGNLSARDPETGLIYIKPSGMPYPDIKAEDVVVMNSEFEVVEGHRKPSIEFNFHIAIMNARKDVNVVIHTHPVYSSVFGVLGEDLPGVSEDFVQIIGDKIINCEYALPGTPELAQHVVKGLGDRNAVMIPNHGTVVVGSDFPSAIKNIFVVEKTAQIYYMARSIGKPNLISEEDIKAMQDFARNHYGQGK
ncbi:MAG: class II aldolase/adducin family protein [Spirochaetales bacterium]|nr:class II aldolase/adducin family protein [Spirochaetales bacterium]